MHIRRRGCTELLLVCTSRSVVDPKDLCFLGNTECTNYFIGYFFLACRKLKTPIHRSVWDNSAHSSTRLLSVLTQVPLESSGGGLAGAPYRYEAAPVTFQASVHSQLVAALFKKGSRSNQKPSEQRELLHKATGRMEGSTVTSRHMKEEQKR